MHIRKNISDDGGCICIEHVLPEFSVLQTAAVLEGGKYCPPRRLYILSRFKLMAKLNIASPPLYAGFPNMLLVFISVDVNGTPIIPPAKYTGNKTSSSIVLYLNSFE